MAISLPRGSQIQVQARPTQNDVGRISQQTLSSAEEFSSNGDNISTGTVQSGVLPIATTSSLGVVQPDGTTITITTGGIISSAGGVSTLELTDGTHDILGVDKITVTGATVGGTSPNATLTIPTGAVGANPTATASDVVVNGTATTFMRSDAAPPVQKTSSTQFGLAKVDGTTIQSVAGIISTTNISSGYIAAWPSVSPSIGDGSGHADASKGIFIAPLENIHIRKIYSSLVGAGTGSFHFQGAIHQVAVTTSTSKVISSIVATSTAISINVANTQQLVFDFGSDIPLIAGNHYIVVVTITDDVDASTKNNIRGSINGSQVLIGLPVPNYGDLSTNESYFCVLAKKTPAVADTWTCANGTYLIGALGYIG